MLKHLFTALLCLLPTLGFAQDKSRAILVLDASGSMWGQIDGKAKITIAQEVIGDLLQSLPADQELGLTVYGHRRKGDCSDIETLIHPGGDTRNAIMMAVSAITPKGKTPLSAAVIQAAKALRYTEERATVILVSDGRETCALDPCEVGRNLEKSGIDFTAHVIGFDISNAKDRAELQCLAEETGGTFRTASNASELNDALQVIAEPAPVEVTFRATEGKNGPVIETPLIWWLGHGDKVLIDNAPHDNNFSMDMLAGSGRVEVMRPEDEATVMGEFTVDSDAMAVTLVLPELLPAASLDAPDTAVAGSNIMIGWDGPDGKNDHITVAEIGSPGTKSIGYVYMRGENPTSLKMPLQAGEYQLRYVLSLGSKILVRRKIIVTPVTATLSPPTPITAGSTFALDWTGPDYRNDHITMAKPGTKASSSETYAYTQHGSPMQLRAPTTPGTYLLRYIAAGPDQMAIASMEVEVVAVSATLESKDTVPAGSDIAVTWTGPDSKNDYLAISEVGDDLSGELSYAYTQNSKGDSLTLRTPTTPGTYELRYIQNGKPKAMLASKTITVVAVSATLESIDTAPAASVLKVTWTGPDTKNDYLAINEIGDDLNGELSYSYTQNSTENSIDLKLPTTPGTYELRYVQNGKPKAMLASKVITVVPVSATIEAVATVAAGDKLQVTWSGPNGERDYIALAEIGSPVTKEVAYEYVERSQGQIVTLDMPNTAGEYELRYIQNGKPKTQLASRPVTITAVASSVASDDTVAAGGRLIVTWSGPNGERDYIALAEVGSPVGKELAYDYVSRSDGQNLALVMPTATGQFELRYIQNGKPKVMLAMKPVTIQAVSASLEADAVAPSGGRLLVNWTGPNNDRDYISIAQIGGKIGKEVTYAYLSESDGQAIFLDMPGVPGLYEMRYIQNGKPKAILATRSLTVEAVAATLSAKATVAPRANLVVEWNGPNYKNDRIAISRVGDKGYETYVYTRDGSPMIIKAPDGVGDFELLYVMGQDGHVLARQPLQVQ